MVKFFITLFLLSFDVLAGPQHIIIPRLRETSRMGSLYSRELPARTSNTYDSLRNYENASGGESYRRSKEAEMKRRCFSLNDSAACSYVRNYL